MSYSENGRCAGAPRRRVLIAQTYVPQYRVAFFEGLRARLAAEDVCLDLIYGDPTEDAAKKSDAVELRWAIHVPNQHIGIGNRKLTYQPIAALSRSYDMVIAEQANKLIVNPVLMCMNAMGAVRFAYWGHGKDFQGRDGFFARAIKRALIPHVHWWFAYNELSASIVRETGFPNARITRVMNTIDNESLAKALATVTTEEMENQKRKLRLWGHNVCVYIGGLYEEKRIPFLLAACERIRQVVPDFEIVFMGGGIDAPLVERFAAEREWVIAAGPTFGREKAVNLKIAKLLLMPGLVGLAIIDAFTAGTPIVTTNVPFHSPEIDYLIDGVNGVMVPMPERLDDYVARTVMLLRSERQLSVLREGCREAAGRYTLNAMVSRFATGIHEALRV